MTPEQERELILRHLATQDVSRWLAFFGYRPDQCDNDLVVNIDGAGLMIVPVTDLTSFIGPVQVYVKPGTDPAFVETIFRRIALIYPEASLATAETGERPC